MFLNLILQFPLLLKGIYVSVFYFITIFYLGVIVFRFSQSYWRNFYNFTLVEWIVNLILPLIALESIGVYAYSCLSRSSFGLLSQGICMILIFMNNLFYIIKIVGVIALAVMYIIKIKNNIENREYTTKEAVINYVLFLFFVLMLSLHVIDRDGSYFFGRWNELSR